MINSTDKQVLTDLQKLDELIKSALSDENIQKLSESIKELNERIGWASSEIHRLRPLTTAINGAEDTIANLEQSCNRSDELRPQLDSTNITAEALRSQLDSTNITAEALRSQLDSTNITAEALRSRLDSTNITAEVLRSRLDSTNITAEALRSRLDSTNITAEALRSRLDSTNITAIDCQNTLIDLIEESQLGQVSLNTCISNSNQQIDTINFQLERLSSQYNLLQGVEQNIFQILDRMGGYQSISDLTAALTAATQRLQEEQDNSRELLETIEQKVDRLIQAQRTPWWWPINWWWKKSINLGQRRIRAK